MKIERPKGTSSFNVKYRFMFLRLMNHWVELLTPPPKSANARQQVLLSLHSHSGFKVAIDLGYLTGAELAAFKESMLIAIEVAEPIVAAADQRALEQMENDYDSDDRCYRPLPHFVIRKGALGAYDQSLLDRRKDVLSGIGVSVLAGRSAPRGGAEVDEAGEGEQAGTQDAEAKED